MSLALNKLRQIIGLSKVAKIQLQNGKTSSTLRLFQAISKLQENQFLNLQKESNSKQLYEQCLDINNKTKKLIKFIETSQLDESKLVFAVNLLDKIMVLEQFQLDNSITKAGLDKKILDTIDPLIRDLMDEMNKLSFVKMTKYSCSGHFHPWEPIENLLEKLRVDTFIFTDQFPYFRLEYDFDSSTASYIEPFHDSLMALGFLRLEKGKEYKPERAKPESTYYMNVLNESDGFTYNDKLFDEFQTNMLKDRMITRWKSIARVVTKFKTYDSLALKKEKEMVIRKKVLLNTHPGQYVNCPLCHKLGTPGIYNKDICSLCESKRN